MPEMAGKTEHDPSLLARLDQVARTVEAAGTGTIDPEERARAQRLALALANQGDGSRPVRSSCSWPLCSATWQSTWRRTRAPRRGS